MLLQDKDNDDDYDDYYDDDYNDDDDDDDVFNRLKIPSESTCW